jgi:D-sedoheptulose 7-phosphate isomerase
MVFGRLKLLNEIIKNTTCTTQDVVLEIKDAFLFFKNILDKAKMNQNMIYVIGNGGSAGIASHFSNDLIKALKIPSSTLVDSNVLTCLANDFGYDKCYSEALKINLKRHDVLVAISSSGNSKNIINATKIAKEKKATIVTLSGFDSTNQLRKVGDLNFWLDKSDYGLVEMGHFFLLHTVIDLFYKFTNLKEQKLETILNA